ncbi:serine/threonine-protein phosphatase with EF-hands 2 [Brachyhypopomus gauderio]|uniref:serine/threonine-protein phosphatase with EF-hands 2 n=1 Tax=Brachyhypopomus gauderio TaxID=698409 RepID=UPI004041DCED
MGSGGTKPQQLHLKKCNKEILNKGHVPVPAMRAALLIQRWYRQSVARLEMRRRCTWRIFQSIEYAVQQDQIKLYNFFGYLMDHFTSVSSERNRISHVLRESEVFHGTEQDFCLCYKDVEVTDTYSGPHLSFPLNLHQVAQLLEAFRHKQLLHSRYVLQLLGETWKLLRVLPNINTVFLCRGQEVTICGDLHGHVEDLLLVFYKNGLPSTETPYVFNGDFVDRGKDSMEILLILFAFQLLYPCDVYLNRGNHEDHIVNLRYGFTKEVLGKYKVHGKRILKLLQRIFSWLPLATVIDQKVLVLHGGISHATDLSVIAKLERHRYVSVLRPPQRRQMEPLWTPGDGVSHGCCSGNGGRRHARSLSPATLQLRLPCHVSTRTVEEELQERRRWAGLSASCDRLQYPRSTPDPHSHDPQDVDEWKQIVDLLWSDPMLRDGCVLNEVRGGGCYWGPDVTRDVLQRHKLQLLIRSHECKQDGYEFCHNRRVLTVFSASNYYEVGSNRGAYVRLGPDLNPHVIQYQASHSSRNLTPRQSVGRTERSALHALREQLFAHKSDLINAFQEFDPEHTGMISTNHWAVAMERVLRLGLPWRVLRSQLLVNQDVGQDDMMNYHHWFRELSLSHPNNWLAHEGLLETMYRHHSSLETIFRIIDTDHSGLISLEEFRQTWKLLSSQLQTEVSDEVVSSLASCIDFNKDGSIDINEFMEAFRLVHCMQPQTEGSVNTGAGPQP